MPLAKQCAFEEPSVETITVENVLTWPQEVSTAKFNYFLGFKLQIIICQMTTTETMS